MQTLKTITELKQSIVDYFNVENQMYYELKQREITLEAMSKAIDENLVVTAYKLQCHCFTPLELYKILSTIA